MDNIFDNFTTEFNAFFASDFMTVVYALIAITLIIVGFNLIKGMLTPDIPDYNEDDEEEGY